MSDKSLALVLVYIREAHPKDGWSIEAGNGKCYMQTRQLDDRLEVARDFIEGMPCAEGLPLVVDDPTTNALDRAYEAPPERLIVVDSAMHVVFASGQGPFQYDIGTLGSFLKAELGTR